MRSFTGSTASRARPDRAAIEQNDVPLKFRSAAVESRNSVGQLARAEQRTIGEVGV